MTETSPIVTAPAHRIFTASLILGVPGSGKTSLAKTFAEYLWETYQKVLLLYSWDGGAIPTDVQQRMKQGLIRFWRGRTRSAPGLGLETLYLATKGYWPRKINPDTGETAPAVELVGPVTARYDVRCPKGHALCTVPVRALIVPMFCTPCGAYIAQNELQVAETVARTKGFEQVGGVFYDGLTSMSDVVLDHMDQQRGEGLIGGEKPAFGGVVVSGGQRFGGNNRADVGFGQTRAHQFVNNSLSIPYLVEGPVFTALAFEATDEGGLPIVGPKLPGRAATDEASAWFGNVMETGKVVDDAGVAHFALWLRPFTDKENRRHLLKTCATSFGVPEKLIDPPESAHQPFTQVSLGVVFKLLDEDLRCALLQTLANAPATPSDYGEAVTVSTPTATSAAVTGLLPLATAAGLTPTTPVATGSALMVAQPKKKKDAPAVVPLAAAPSTASVVQTTVSGTVAVAPVSGAVPPPPGKAPVKAPGA